jgi:anti-sigma factor RsiW
MDASTKPCDRVRNHLSALVDGALQPLEVIALRRHVEQCPACHVEVVALEQTKLLVHLYGGAGELGNEARDRIRSRLFDGQMEGPASRSGWVRAAGWWPLTAAVALAVGFAVPWILTGPATPPAPPASAGSGVVMDEWLLGQMTAVHANRLPSGALADLRRSGALVGLDQLSGDFVTRHGERARIVLASHTECEVPTPGASLAVWDASRVTLSTEIAAALDTKGVHVDVIDGVEVRLSRNGDRLLMLMAEVREPPADGAI